jgi:hypothetical protein
MEQGFLIAKAVVERLPRNAPSLGEATHGGAGEAILCKALQEWHHLPEGGEKALPEGI